MCWSRYADLGGEDEVCGVHSAAYFGSPIEGNVSAPFFARDPLADTQSAHQARNLMVTCDKCGSQLRRNSIRVHQRTLVCARRAQFSVGTGKHTECDVFEGAFGILGVSARRANCT